MVLMLKFEVVASTIVMSVSYTHLDVYKRQLDSPQLSRVSHIHYAERERMDVSNDQITCDVWGSIDNLFVQTPDQVAIRPEGKQLH